MKCLVKMMLEWILGLLVEISKELDEWELFRLKGFNQSTKSRIACYHDKNIKQLKRLLENKDVIGFYITIKEMEFVFRLSNRVGNYCITNKWIALQTLEGHKIKTRINILALGLNDLYLIKSNKGVPDWDIRKEFSQTLHENLKFFFEDFHDCDSTEPTPSKS